ncbi:amino acid/polyamine/organocation transporter (APC superfamily) [Saccharothrix saharensis]|uniref:Amino acid/polyamine/organocation transporter (APC superfamily) n=1 Tax=Saccharothrix saharensis TaxID=571190 RepID=A0A543J8Y6_9PSEU|nr:APC family permease [Saccharothrix saharensis]TQM79278.1 amino acid/polyamine/organocation transporter (APC superfamily) [Saccharothrix saharensis]
MSPEPDRPTAPRLARRLGTGGAVVIGLGSMIGAGVFAAFGPAARAAGAGLLLGLAIAAVVAYCNATSSARLAARYPASGGTYVYGRERLGPFWGYLAGWGFVVGKTASCAAMALTVAAYALPEADRPARTALAVVAVLALTALNYRGVQKSAWVTRVIVVVVLFVLGAAVVAAFTGGTAAGGNFRPFPGAGVGDILQSAGLLFFAFAGYARIATLGEEVRDPRRTIPRAVPIALGIALVVYALVAVAVLAALGPDRLAAASDPLAAAVAAGSWSWLTPVVRVGAAVAALGSLLALVLGVSRTALAMARDGHLPRTLAAVHPRHRVPHHAEVAVGLAVAVLVGVVDLRGAIGFSSFAVLVYYAVANASAWTLRPDEGRPPRAVPVVGLVGCVVLAATLPTASVVTGVVVVGLGAVIWFVRRLTGRTRHP